MNTSHDRFVACGMYVLSKQHEAAWQQLFDRFFELSGCEPGRAVVRFEHGSALLRLPGLWFGHTCGYPLMTELKDDFSPFCVPLFDVEGTSGRLYSSRIIVAADADIESLADCRDRVAAVNDADSNSGMNVLRHAVATIHGGGPFFAGVVTSGGHRHSIEAVANGAADVAAIDCVTYALLEDSDPQLCARVRVLCDSVRTCGLPLVMPCAEYAASDTDALVEHLNQALALSAPQLRATLHLRAFESVTLDDYQDILDVEQYAIERGYPELH